RQTSQAAGGSSIFEHSTPEIAKQGKGFTGQRGYANVRQTIIVIVSKVCTHAGDRTPVFSQSDPRQKGNLFESAITLILKQGIRHVVIRHEGIQIAVLIVVFECHTHSSARPVHQPRRLGHILKSPIATVTVELVVNSSEISRVAVDTQIALPVTAVPF